ncbi:MULTISPECIES: hypothetical protein [Thermococcus]|uniref:Uncharacterized protein n=1 Tax=Thermococcus nautili TaxID=195522 RepID=W8P2U6_9EURY|nr:MULTISPECIES: hypothetical protein [Thermococcus]AHL23126.1 hypothetical protein BD01_1518 [Thermococcus nautili]NJE50085.1 hypothetical protein [Thermococcus sp. 9N3]CAI1492410.1 conserved exported protein of unknown function [Thermococcus nautili]
MRGQISLDLLFAVAIISITMLSVMNVALSEKTETEVLGTSAQLKAFAIDIRGTVARLYASPGITVVKESPVELGPGEWINVTLRADGYLQIRAQIGGREYVVVEKLQVPPGTTSSVLLTQTMREFKLSSRRLPDGVEVVVET